MAAMEFIGFTKADEFALKPQVTKLLNQLPFAHHVVFIEHSHALKVIDLMGNTKPFVRFYTRNIQRGQHLMQIFAPLFPVEIILIGVSVINGCTYNFKVCDYE